MGMHGQSLRRWDRHLEKQEKMQHKATLLHNTETWGDFQFTVAILQAAIEPSVYDAGQVSIDPIPTTNSRSR